MQKKPLRKKRTQKKDNTLTLTAVSSYGHINHDDQIRFTVSADGSRMWIQHCEALLNMAPSSMRNLRDWLTENLP